MTVGELKALLADKSDACEVQFLVQELHIVGGAMSYTTGVAFNEPVAEEKVEEATDAVSEAENASDVTTEAVA